MSDLHPQYVSGQASTSHNAQPPMNTARGPVPAYYPTTVGPLFHSIMYD